MGKLTGFVSPAGDKAYFFTDSDYVRYDVAADRVDDGYPLPIAGNWPGLFESGIDAAVCWPDGSVYFFAGDQYAKYDWEADRVADGYPQPIAGNWPGLFESGVDAGVVWNSGNAYFFSGSEYVKYDPVANQAVDGPLPIAGNWPGLFESGIDAALWWPSGKAYFFSGDQYAQYDAEADKVADGYPLPIAGNWPGLPIGAIVPPSTQPDGQAISVRDYFPTFTQPLEGRVPYMYQDVKGLVTVAVGNLIDRPEDAAALSWVHIATGLAATRDEIVAEWHRIKNAPGLAKGGHLAAKKIATLKMTELAMDELVKAKFDTNEKRLAAFYPDWANWPADARLGAHSIAWAGAYFPAKWPNFNAAANAQDWAAAVTHCTLSEAGNPGIAPRNKANRQLFSNAAAVVARGIDRTLVYYPTAL
ncbi:hemopexin repeat-containing protein [Kribbella sindirgiensis]|uniref:Hemopexin n=1 Tax=Kribbella sindirgiensis TaxID=1124744 RepID=A0A4R0J9Y5_9ACTN|nr:hemopexin repeat-containing protein [Kribbella sindirgiensis]TCC43401.1 hypothetical protein E0H50_02715 [Kribbella sindirgiensis]